MWTATIDGFFSTVQDRDNHRHVLVRMRSEADWHKAVARFRPLGAYRLNYTHDADYPFRASVLKRLWSLYLGRVVSATTYDNFKNEIHRVNADRAKTYMSVWSDLLDIEDEADSGVAHEPRWRDKQWSERDWAEWREEEAEMQRRDAADRRTHNIDYDESLWDRWEKENGDTPVGELDLDARIRLAAILDNWEDQPGPDMVHDSVHGWVPADDEFEPERGNVVA